MFQNLIFAVQSASQDPTLAPVALAVRNDLFKRIPDKPFLLSSLETEVSNPLLNLFSSRQNADHDAKKINAKFNLSFCNELILILNENKLLSNVFHNRNLTKSNLNAVNKFINYNIW